MNNKRYVLPEDELVALVALFAKRKAAMHVSNVTIAEMCCFSASTIDRFFRGDLKSPTWAFVRVIAQYMGVPTEDVNAVAPNLLECFRDDALMPQDRIHVASSQDLNNLADTYRQMVQQKEDTFINSLHSLEDDFSDAIERMRKDHAQHLDDLRAQHSVEVANLKKTCRQLFYACCVLVFALVVSLCIPK